MIGRGGKDQSSCGAAPTPPQQPHDQGSKKMKQSTKIKHARNFFFSSKLRDDSKSKSSSYSIADLVAHEKM